jgi:hypothetical protein
MQHASNCQCSICHPEEPKPLIKLPKLKPHKETKEPIKDDTKEVPPIMELTESAEVMPPYKSKSLNDLNTKVEQYHSELSNRISNLEHPPKLRGQSWYKSIGVWIALILALAMIYGIYLFYMTQNGKVIRFPW